MKKRLFLLLSMTIAFVALAQAAGQFTVTSVKGKITFLTNKGQRLPLEVNDIVDKTTVVNIPFHAILELVDQTDNKRYIIKAPGRAPISVLLRDNRNSVESLTRQYVKTLVDNLTNSGAVKGVVVTEPAAITRKQAKVGDSDMDMDLDLDMDMDMDMSLNMNFSKKDLINEYRQFRQQCTQTYINFVREAWESYTGEAPKKMPQEKDAAPVFIPVNDDGEEGKPITYEEAKAEIARQKKAAALSEGKEACNMAEAAIQLVGKDIFEKLVKGYTAKQWGRPAEELPPFIIKSAKTKMPIMPKTRQFTSSFL